MADAEARADQLAGQVAELSAGEAASSSQSLALTRRVGELESQLQSSDQREPQPAGVPREKLDAMAAMLREQQEELHESYRFAAASKLLVVLARRDVLCVASSLSSWRRSCSLATVDQAPDDVATE